MSIIKMKDSRIEWVGDIPKDWTLTRVKSFAKIKARIGWQALRSDEFTDNLNEPYCITGTDIINSKLVYDKAYHVSKERYLIDKNIIIKVNDVLVTKDGTIGKVAVVDNIPEAGATLNSGLFRVRLNLEKFNPTFFKYIVNSFVFNKYIDLKTTGSTINHLYQYLFEPFVVPNPLITQQTAIANYLDHHTSKIDKEISLLEQKVEKLDEYKQALIYETVTKGLDKNVPMKDSGIEWIGMIPEHWEVKRVKDILSNLGGGNYGDDEDKEGLLLPCISISDFKNGNLENNTNIKMNRIYKKKNIIKQGSILIEKSGGGEKVPVGRVIYAKKDIEAYYTNFVQGIKIIKNNSNYIYYCLSAIHKNKLHMNFVKQTTGLQNFEFNKFSTNFLLPIPDIDSQKNISEYLDELSLKVDKKKELINKKVELLKEYKQSLIYEAVTGKIEIKE